MTIINTPHQGFHQMFPGVPHVWEQVTPHNTDFLRGDSVTCEAAFALYSFDGGDITYHDEDLTTPKLLSFVPGAILPGLFTRVNATGTDSTAIWAAFMSAS